MNAASSATYTTDYEPTEEEMAELVAQLDRLVEGVYPHVSDGARERTLVAVRHFNDMASTHVAVTVHEITARQTRGWTRREALRNLRNARQFASDSQAAAADEVKGVAVELVTRFGFHPVKAESTVWRAVERLTPTDADPEDLHALGVA